MKLLLILLALLSGTALAATSYLPDVIMDSSLSSQDQTYNGTTLSGALGETVAFRQVVYLKNDGKFWKAKADAAGTMPAIGVCVVGGDADDTGTILIRGMVRDDTWDFTVGSSLYVSDTTAGTLTDSAPDTAGDQVQFMGIAISADVALITPNIMLIEIAA